VVLRKTFEPKRDEIGGGWIQLHNEELYFFYSSPNIFKMIRSKKIRYAGNVASMREEEEKQKEFCGKAIRKRPLGRPRCRTSRRDLILDHIFPSSAEVKLTIYFMT
jgi:hypothetical protein